jgi:hypothetical protein
MASSRRQENHAATGARLRRRHSRPRPGRLRTVRTQISRPELFKDQAGPGRLKAGPVLKKYSISETEHCTNDQRAAEFESVSRQPDKPRNRTLICKSSTPNAENSRNQGAGSGAQGAETGEVRVQEEAIRLQRGLLQRREEQVKVQANRIAELENMIGLRTSAVPRWMNELFMPRRQGRRYRDVSFHVDENDVASTPSNRTKPRSRALSAKHDPCQLGRPRRNRERS